MECPWVNSENKKWKDHPRNRRLFMKIKYTIAALLLVLVMMVAACGNTETSAANPFVTTQLTEGGVPAYSIIYPYRRL